MRIRVVEDLHCMMADGFRHLLLLLAVNPPLSAHPLKQKNNRSDVRVKLHDMKLVSWCFDSLSPVNQKGLHIWAESKL